MTMNAPVVALGHSNRAAEEFLAMLQTQGVRLVVDIRRHPGSRKVPWAGRDALPAWLSKHGIEYRHEEDLGGRRRPRPDSANNGWRSASFRGYADHMQTPAFRAALERVMDAEGPVAIMCAEAVPWRCHRRLVADALVARGIHVVQAVSPTDIRPHELTPFAVVHGDAVTYPATDAA